MARKKKYEIGEPVNRYNITMPPTAKANLERMAKSQDMRLSEFLTRIGLNEIPLDLPQGEVKALAGES